MFDTDTTALLVMRETSRCLHERSYLLSNEVQPEVKLHLVEALCSVAGGTRQEFLSCVYGYRIMDQ